MEETRSPASGKPGAELDTQIASVGVRLIVAADVFFFAAWWFAFLYLRALNNNGAWMAPGIARPNGAVGVGVLVLVLASAGSYYLASRSGPQSPTWRALALLSLVLGLAACAVQGVQQWNLGFGLTQGGYPSVYAGLMGSFTVQLLGAMFWLATVIVQARPGRDTQVRPAPAVSFGLVLYFLAVACLISDVLLYLV
jgi:heme/copper-type cytochrome/quinol oxidase subunit 3